MGLAELIQQVINTNLSKVHTALPAVIVEVYENGTDVTVQPTVNPLTSGGNSKLERIHDVPYLCPQSPTKGVRWTPEVGEPVFLLISEVSLDTYMDATTPIVDAVDGNRFSLSDAVAIPGLLPLAKQTPLDPTTSVEIKAEGQTITMKKDGDILIGQKAISKIVKQEMKEHYVTHTHTDTNGVLTTPPNDVPTVPLVPITPVTAATFITEKTSAE